MTYTALELTARAKEIGARNKALRSINRKEIIDFANDAVTVLTLAEMVKALCLTGLMRDGATKIAKLTIANHVRAK